MITTYTDDAAGNRTCAVTGSTCTSASDLVTTGYDALGRPETKATTGTGGVARAAYAWTRNAAGSVLAEASTITSDPTNNTRLFGYDPAGRLTGFTDGATTTGLRLGRDARPHQRRGRRRTRRPTTYDAANRPLTQNGVSNAYGSDADGRLTTRPEPDGSASQRLEWDSLGRLMRVRPPNGNSTIAAYTYDPLDRLHLVDHGGADRVRVRYAGLHHHGRPDDRRPEWCRHREHRHRLDRRAARGLDRLGQVRAGRRMEVKVTLRYKSSSKVPGAIKYQARPAGARNWEREWNWDNIR